MLVLAIAGANARQLFGATWEDTRYHTEIAPPRLAAAESVRAGALPAWWEGSGLGVPLAGEPSHGAMYPPTWLAGSPRAFDWLAIAHLIWLAIGVAMWARLRSPRSPRHRTWTGDGSEPAAVVVALLVATSGLIASAAMRGALPAVAHLPWIGVTACWLAESETKRDRARGAAALGLLLGVVGLSGNLAGFVDALVLAVVLVVRRRPRAVERSEPADVATLRSDTLADALARDNHRRARSESSIDRGRTARGNDERDGARDGGGPSGDERARSDDRVRTSGDGERRSPSDVGSKDSRSTVPYAIYVVAALFGGVAISAAQWLPAALQLSSPHAGAEVSGLPLARLLELVVPIASGSPDPDRALTTLAGEHAWAPSIFVGAPLLALAAVRVPSRRVLAILGALVVFTLIAGRGGWPAWLGAPEVHLTALVIVLGAHAGSGLDALLAGERRAFLAVAAGVGCSAIALAALGVLGSSVSSPTLDRALLDGVLGLACHGIALAIVWRTARPGRALPVALALLVLPSFGAQPAIAPTTERAVVAVMPAWAELAAATPVPRRVYRPERMIDVLVAGRATVTTPTSKPAAEPPGRETLEDLIATFAGTSGARWGIAVARSEDLARLPAHDATWQAASSGGGKLLDRFGIGLAILPETVVVPRSLRALGVRSSWALVEFPGAPAASVMRGWARAVDPRDAFSLMFQSDVPGGDHGHGATLRAPDSMRGTVVLGEPGDAKTSKEPPLPCTIDDWSTGSIELRCTSDVAGYAVVSSSAMPGWSVTIDEVAAPWITADVLRRAVAIPAGTHRVRWTYSAPGLGFGLAVAGIGLALLIALALASRKP